jgi:hypothetical protein
MRNDKRRITVIARGPGTPQRAWDSTSSAPSRLLFLEAMPILRHVIDTGVPEMNLDIERVVIDHASTAAEYLELLAALPVEFNADVVLIRDDTGGFLSASARGGNRVLYALSALDVQFYLETHALMSTTAAQTAMPLAYAMMA